MGYPVPMGHQKWGTSNILSHFLQTMFRYTQFLKSNELDLNLFITLIVNYSTRVVIKTNGHRDKRSSKFSNLNSVNSKIAQTK